MSGHGNLTAQQIVNARRVLNGPTDSLRAVNPVKYPWTRDILDEMKSNQWFPTEVELSKDNYTYKHVLTEGEKLMHDRALAFLSNLDAIQLDNLALNIVDHISTHEIKNVIYRQIWEEIVHVESYSLMVENTVEDPLIIYDMHRNNPVLDEKNKYIVAQSNAINEGYSEQKFVRAAVANVALEGIYFFTGFLAFYTLARGGKMLGEKDMISFIQRDELTHLKLFTNIYKEVKIEIPDIFTRENEEACIEIIDSSVQLEKAWGRHLIEKGAMGLTPGIIDDFVEALGDRRLGELGLRKIYNKKMPIPWFDKFSAVGGREVNFFESKPREYQDRGTLEW